MVYFFSSFSLSHALFSFNVLSFLPIFGRGVCVVCGCLLVCAWCVQVDVVRVLLEAGADPEVRDDRGNTVLDTIALINTPITQEITNLIKCTSLQSQSSCPSNLTFLPSLPPCSLSLSLSLSLSHSYILSLPSFSLLLFR